MFAEADRDPSQPAVFWNDTVPIASWMRATTAAAGLHHHHPIPPRYPAPLGAGPEDDAWLAEQFAKASYQGGRSPTGGNPYHIHAGKYQASRGTQASVFLAYMGQGMEIGSHRVERGIHTPIGQASNGCTERLVNGHRGQGVNPRPFAHWPIPHSPST